MAHTNKVGAAGGDACIIERVSCPDPPAIGPGTRSVAIGFGGNRRGGIGTEQQRVELGFERGEPCILVLEQSGFAPQSLGFLPRFDRVDLRIERWMPI